MPIVLVRDSETVVMFVTLQLDVRAATLNATNTTLVQCHVMLEISWSQSVWNSYILPSIQEKSKTLHPIDGFMDASLRLFLLVKYTNFERIEVEKYPAWLSNREHDVAWHRTEVVLRIAAWLLYVPTKCISIARHQNMDTKWQHDKHDSGFWSRNASQDDRQHVMCAMLWKWTRKTM